MAKTNGHPVTPLPGITLPAATREAPPPLVRRATDPVALTPVNGRQGEPFSVGSSFAAVLRCHPAHARVLRRHLRLTARLPQDRLDMVERLASELFNNAWQHSRSRATGTVTVAVFRLATCVQVKVTDDGPRPDRPTRPAPRADALDPLIEGGLGLWLVEQGSDRWGVHREQDGRTTTWFELDHHRATPPLGRG